MGGVAGQEHPVPLEGRGHPRVMEVHPAPQDRRQRGGAVLARQEPADPIGLGHLLLVVVRLEQPLEPAVPIGQRDDEDGLHRAAVDGGVRRVEDVVGDVDDQPLGRRGLPRQVDADQSPDQAAPPVGTDEIAGSDLDGLAVRSAEASRHHRGVLFEILELPPEAQVDGRKAFDTLAQRRFQEGLEEQVPPGPAEGLRSGLHVGEAPSPGRVVADGGVLHDVGQQLVDEPDRLIGA